MNFGVSQARNIDHRGTDFFRGCLRKKICPRTCF